ncbi:A24 family peptidase [Marinimicrococcus flavescens]|uniref:A24 family peptidase n=1 Tax=Marinimicrococcus flavescens TaxID=3031815 RepID=A0AAP3UYX9_9PROT|nr:A24 family peptidase [Marinimicrococcus flavescens]
MLELASQALLLAAAATLLLAALCDVAWRLIPNGVSLALVALGTGLRLAQAGPEGLIWTAAASALLFAVMLLAWSRGLMGGGDAKLLPAAAMTLPAAAVPQLVLMTALAGGALALLYLLLQQAARRLPAFPRQHRGQPLLRRLLAAEGWRLRRRGPLPYGVAIAAAALMLLLRPA